MSKFMASTLFKELDKIWFDLNGTKRYCVFISYVNNVELIDKDIPQLLKYFNSYGRMTMESILGYVKITKMSSTTLIKCLKMVSDTDFKYILLNRFIKYVDSFDTFNHKSKIIGMFGRSNVYDVMDLIKKIPIKNKETLTN